jgi:hypothetical protein
MMDEMEKAYYMTESELMVLLSALGQKQFYGYRLQTALEADEEQVAQTLFSLAKKRIVRPEEKGLRIDEEYRHLLEGIMEADRVVVTADKEQRFPQLYIYVGRQLTILQSSGQTGIMVKLEVREKASFAQQVMENGFRLESSLQDETLYQKETMEEAQEQSPFFPMDMEELFRQPSVRNALFVLEIAQKKKVYQILLLEKGLQEEIWTEDGERRQCYLYSPKKMTEILDGLIG